jgi:sugar phosphate isomerase/epimerase
VFFLALSCLQGRPALTAADELMALKPDGLQLTGGNLPDRGLAAWAGAHTTMTHHGFSFTARRRAVWDADGRCLVDNDSVHPPKAATEAARYWRDFVLDDRPDLVLETMFPGYELGSGPELVWAMNEGLRLAVDISHLHLQTCAGVLDRATHDRVLNYDRIAEVHVSHNGGKADTHRPLTAQTSGLAWAKERLAAGTPVVLESYFHRLTSDQRRAQIDLVRG